MVLVVSLSSFLLYFLDPQLVPAVNVILSIRYLAQLFRTYLILKQ